jgi:hypothetical protein
MDNRLPYVGYGHCGQPIKISYTEEVVGSASKAHSSPIPPTFFTPGMGVFALIMHISGGTLVIWSYQSWLHLQPRYQLTSELDHQSVCRYIADRRPNIMACILLADHLGINPNELLTLAGCLPLQVLEIHAESTETLPPEAVDVARDIARISSTALRKQVAEAIRTLLKQYFE